MKNKVGQQRRNQLQGNMWRGADRRVSGKVQWQVQWQVQVQVDSQVRGQMLIPLRNHLQEQNRNN